MTIAHLGAERIADAIEALDNDGISDRGDALVDFADSCVEAAKDVLRYDPDVSSQDAASKAADSIVFSAPVLKVIQCSSDLMGREPEIEPGANTIEGIGQMVLYDLAAGIIMHYIEANRPEEIPWDDATPNPGEFVLGRTDDGFIYIHVELRERERGEELSIVGHSRSMWGQVGDTLRSELQSGILELAPEWTNEGAYKLLDIWDRWHLNGMNSACEHQRAMGWTYEEFRGYGDDPYKGSGCPFCGHRIGGKWLFEPLPADVHEFITELINESR